MPSKDTPPACSFRAVVYRRTTPTPDFSRGEAVVLPGQHTAAGAWSAVYAALAAPGGEELIGGEIQPA